MKTQEVRSFQIPYQKRSTRTTLTEQLYRGCIRLGTLIDDDVNRYGLHTNSNGLVGSAYEWVSGAGVSIGSVEIQPTGNTRVIYTGDSPGYPHVGLGFPTDHRITDNNASS